MSPLVIPLALTAIAIATVLYAVGPQWSWLLPFLRGIEEKKPSHRHRPPVGCTQFHQLWYVRKLYDFHTEVLQRYPTVRLVSLRNDCIYTVDPANVEHILKTNYANYGKSGTVEESVAEIFGEGIVVVDGDRWRHQRKIASPQFSGKMIRNNATAVFKKNAIKLAATISESSNKAEIIAIDDLFEKSTVDSAFEILASVQLDVLSGKNAEGDAFIRALDDALNLLIMRKFVPFWRIMRSFNLGSEARVKESVKVVDRFVYTLIRDRIEDKCSARDQDGHEKKKDFLSRLLESSTGDSGTINQKHVRDEILTFIIAGKDTTAKTLSWFIYMLCKHPSVQEKISLEIKEATESSGNSDAHDFSFQDFAEDITEEAIGKMHYLHATISETLRLHPSFPLDLKVCKSDDVFPNGYSVRKGDLVGYHPYAMGRMESLWGEDAQVFRPERWIDEHGRFRPESPYKFSAFQAGPRICMGKDFAMRQMKVYAALLIHFFRFEMADKNETINYKLSITLSMDNGLHVYAYAR